MSRMLMYDNKHTLKLPSLSAILFKSIWNIDIMNSISMTEGKIILISYAFGFLTVVNVITKPGKLSISHSLHILHDLVYSIVLRAVFV